MRLWGGVGGRDVRKGTVPLPAFAGYDVWRSETRNFGIGDKSGDGSDSGDSFIARGNNGGVVKVL